jgi:hypothetical protein
VLVLLLVHRNRSCGNWIQLGAAICEHGSVLALLLLMLLLLLLAITILDLTDLSPMVAIGAAAAHLD